MMEGRSTQSAGCARRRGARKRTTPSIPTRFHTVLREETGVPNAFGNRCKRFSDRRYMTEAPGPGAYSAIQGASGKLAPTSFSAKGYGLGFVSKTTRFGVEIPEDEGVPGPGYYSSSLELPPSRLDFSKTNASANFIKPKCFRGSAKIEKVADHPAPGQYDVLKKSQPRYKVKTMSAAFASKSQRGWKTTDSMPAPGAYFKPISYTGQPGARSSFVSSSQRGQCLLPRHLLETPAPGTYGMNAERNSKSAGSKRGRKQPRMFNEQATENRTAYIRAQNHIQPGPGAYSVSVPATVKTITSSFQSNSKRISENPKAKPPGPAYYNPSAVPPKRSFLLNVTKEWV